MLNIVAMDFCSRSFCRVRAIRDRLPRQIAGRTGTGAQVPREAVIASDTKSLGILKDEDPTSFSSNSAGACVNINVARTRSAFVLVKDRRSMFDITSERGRDDMLLQDMLRGSAVFIMTSEMTRMLRLSVKGHTTALQDSTTLATLLHTTVA